jgi:hypothetical protein
VASQDQWFPAADITEFEWGAKDNQGNKQRKADAYVINDSSR